MVSQARALLVDDDSSWQQVLREILEDMDLAVDSATNFTGAVKLAAESHRIAIVDLCLVESDHHNQDGIRVVDEIKSHDPDCVILMLTGHATVELAVSVLTEHGVSNCLRKEVFHRTEFKRLIERSLEAAPVRAGWGEADPRKQAEVNDETRKVAAGPRNNEVLIVEDDSGWRGILHELLAESGFHVRAATSFGEALGCLRRGKYAMAIVDLSLAGPAEERISRSGSDEDLADLEGYRLLATIQSSGVPVIVLSGLSDPDRIEEAYKERRIFAYIEKQSFDRRVFLQTVEDIRTSKDTPNDLDVLTEREQEVLELIAQGKTNKEIAELLVITTNTVKRHLKAIFMKLDIHTRSAAAAKVANLDK